MKTFTFKCNFYFSCQRDIIGSYQRIKLTELHYLLAINRCKLFLINLVIHSSNLMKVIA